MYQPSGRSPVACGVDADRLGEVGALLGFGHVLVVDPFEAVARDLPARLAHGRDRVRIARQRGRDAEHRHRHVAFREQSPQPPEARARAVFVHRLHVHVPLARPGLRAEHVGEKRFRRGVAMQDVALAAFLVIDDELHGDARAARPARVGRVAAVADEVAGVAGEIARGHPRTLLRRRAGGEPGGEDLALLRGHLGDVAGRHGVGAHRVDLDQAGVAADVLGPVEQHALGRRVHAGPDRPAPYGTCCSGRGRRCAPPRH